MNFESKFINLHKNSITVDLYAKAVAFILMITSKSLNLLISIFAKRDKTTLLIKYTSTMGHNISKLHQFILKKSLI